MEKKCSNKFTLTLVRAAAIVLLLALLLVGFAFLRDDVATAEPAVVTQTLTVSNVQVHRGEEFSVDIVLNGNEDGMYALRLEITFNKDALTLTDVYRPKKNAAEISTGWAMAKADCNMSETERYGYAGYGGGNNPFVIFLHSINKVKGNGKIATLTFTSAANATVLDENGYTDYPIRVTCDPTNTRVVSGQNCDVPVSGGNVGITYGKYWVKLLYKEEGDNGAEVAQNKIFDNNTAMLSLQDIAGNIEPYKTATPEYSYSFRGWALKEVDSTENHHIFEATFDAVPVPYDIRFHQGIEQDDGTIDYEDDRLADYLGATYVYDSDALRMGYGAIVPFDECKPTTGYDVHPAYTFTGWYVDSACTEPVDFVTMPVGGADLYGYFKQNVAENFSDDATKTVFETTVSVADGYVYATVDVTKNFAFNAVLLGLDYDDDLLTLDAIRVAADSPFYGDLAPMLPPVNAALRTGTADLTAWQSVDGDYDEDVRVLFLSATKNVTATGTLVTFRFTVKDSVIATKTTTTIGVTVGERDMARVKGNGSSWYVSAITKADDLEIIRVAAPAVSTAAYTYDDGNKITYASFADPSAILYYTVEDHEQTHAGNYTVTATLEAKAKRYITWAVPTTDPVGVTFSTDPLEYAFSIAPKSVKKPVEFKNALTRYVYTGSDISYAFAQSEDSAYYTKANGVKAAAGTYDVTVSLNNKADTVWETGGTADLHFEFIIHKKPVTKPSIAAKPYTGDPQRATVADTDFYTVTTNDFHTDIGNYPVVLTLRDTVKDNYCWQGSENLSTTLVFSIVETVNYWEVSPSVFDKYYDGEPIKTSAAKAKIGSIPAVITFYDVHGTLLESAPTNAGVYTVRFFVNDIAGAKGIDETLDFEIYKITLVTPEPQDRLYIYNGTEQTFLFKEAGDTGRYTLTNGTKAEVGPWSVKAALIDKDNYTWADGSVDDIVWQTEMRHASRSASTDEYALTLTETSVGFPYANTLSLTEETIDVAALVERIKAMQVAVSGKCVIAALNVEILNGTTTVTGRTEDFEYLLTIANPTRNNYVTISLVDEDLKVYEATRVGDAGYRFTASRTGVFYLLADHLFDKEVAAEKYLKTPADCTHAAVYYKSCSCGECSADEEETFVYGEPNGHSYDYTAIEWKWASDASSCVAKVVCTEDGEEKVYTIKPVLTRSVPPQALADGEMVYTASFTVGEDTYSATKTITVDATGHVYEAAPAWTWTPTATSYDATATFVSTDGEDVSVVQARIEEITATEDEVTFHALVIFNASEYRATKTIPLPTAIFTDNKQTVSSAKYVPGTKVIFTDAPARAGEDGVFYGWKERTSGVLITKDDEGNYFKYTIGLTSVTFDAQWQLYAHAGVSVTDAFGRPIADARVSIMEGDREVVAPTNTAANGQASFTRVPYGNYKLVAKYTAGEEGEIVRSTIVDVDKPEVTVTIAMPGVNFHTVLEGDGSAEGLERAISEEEKSGIKSEATGETVVSKIVITQTRETTVGAEVRSEMSNRARAELGDEATIVDYYDVRMIKTTTYLDAAGNSYSKNVTLSLTDGYQVNIFRISSALRAKITEVGGTAENIFAFKRHTNETTGTTNIDKLAKVTPEEGASAEYECFFIKRVAGMDYIAVVQKEYSVLAFGVSSGSVLLSNEIRELSAADMTYGDTWRDPIVSAKYNGTTAEFTYSDTYGGPYTKVRPTTVGNYYVKATIKATSLHAGAEKIGTFSITKKLVTKPDADTTRFIYSGAAQTYQVAAGNDYTVEGNSKINAGNYVVTVTLKDTENCMWTDGTALPLYLDFVIEKKKLSEATGLEFKDETFYFNFKPHSIYVTGDIPDDVTVLYEGNEETDIGRYYVKATLVSDNENYEAAAPMIAVMTIRINWVIIIVIAAIILILIVVILVMVERAIRAAKKNEKENAAMAKEGGSND